MKKNIIITLIAVITGIAGMFIRGRQLDTGYTDMHLHVEGDVLGTVLLILAIAVIVAVVLISLFMKGGSTPDAKGHMPAMVLTVLGAAILFVSGVIGFVGFTSSRDILRNLVFPLFAVAAAFCTAVYGMGIYKGTEGGKLAAPGAIPAFFCCLWLIICYRDNAIEPTISLYIVELAAIIFLAVSICFTLQTRVYGKVYSFAPVFPAMAMFLTLTSLAENHSISDVLLLVYSGIETLTMLLYSENTAVSIKKKK